LISIDETSLPDEVVTHAKQLHAQLENRGIVVVDEEDEGVEDLAAVEDFLDAEDAKDDIEME
jgi:hypothetical protein